MYGLSSKDEDELQAQADPDMMTLRVRLFRFLKYSDAQSAAGLSAVA